MTDAAAGRRGLAIVLVSVAIKPVAATHFVWAGLLHWCSAPSGRTVRFWLEADIHPHSDLRPLYPRKQTLPAKNWIGP